MTTGTRQIKIWVHVLFARGHRARKKRPEVNFYGSGVMSGTGSDSKAFSKIRLEKAK
jgi:hypothetical protein